MREESNDVDSPANDWLPIKRKKEQHPSHEAIVYPERSLRYSYEAFYQEVKETGKGLMALGVQKGDHIAIMAPNIPEWLILQFARLHWCCSCHCEYQFSITGTRLFTQAF